MITRPWTGLGLSLAVVCILSGCAPATTRIAADGSAGRGASSEAAPSLDAPHTGGGAHDGEATDKAGVRLTAADGWIGTSRTIEELAAAPAIVHLDGALRRAVLRATEQARDEGVAVTINSAWRSKRHQQALLDEAVAEYGSMEAARRWVNTPERSSHTRGAAVDIGPADAWTWMSTNGAAFGLCQTYANEAWHFELATEPGGTCPDQLADGSAQ